MSRHKYLKIESLVNTQVENYALQGSELFTAKHDCDYLMKSKREKASYRGLKEQLCVENKNGSVPIATKVRILSALSKLL